MKRTSLILVSVWLLATFPFNITMLKHLIQDYMLFEANLWLGLNNNLILQYALNLGFIACVAGLLFKQRNLGEVLAKVLLFGSCCEVVGVFLSDRFLESPREWPTPIGFVVLCATFLINVFCIYLLHTGKEISN